LESFFKDLVKNISSAGKSSGRYAKILSISSEITPPSRISECIDALVNPDGVCTKVIAHESYPLMDVILMPKSSM